MSDELRSSLAHQIRRLSKILKTNSEEEIKDYSRRFGIVKDFYDKFLKDMIITNIPLDKIEEFAVKFFGSKEVKFAAIDGTEISREVTDLILFFGGAYSVTGTIKFKNGRIPEVSYSEELFTSGKTISACVPIYINEVYEIDDEFSHKGEEEFNIAPEDIYVINNSQISLWIMHFAEYFLAYKMVTEEGVKILLMDRNLPGDQANFISKTSKKDFWEKLAILGMDVDGIKIDVNHLEILRYRIFNPSLDVIAPRGDYLKFRVLFTLETSDKPLSLEEICEILQIPEERKERVKRALASWEDKGVVIRVGEKYSIDEKYKDVWEKIKKVAINIGEKIFLSEDYARILKIEKDGKFYWLTTLDLAFLTLIIFYSLLEECWKRKVLLIGLVKDTSAREFKNHLIPILQNSGVIERYLKPEDISSLPNTDRMLLQAISILNSDKFSPPWCTIEYDSSFITLVPEERNYVRGAIRNKISPERIFLKSYIQLVQAERDPKIRSNVLALTRLVYPEFDYSEDKLLHLVNRYSKTIEEPVDVIIYKNNGVENVVQTLIMATLLAMVDSAILEVFGHNKPLFIADKIAKWHVGLFIRVIESLELWIKEHPDLRDFIFYMSSFRKRRWEIERYRRRG